LTRTRTEQRPNKNRTNAEQKPNKTRFAPDGANLSRRLRDGVFLLADACTLPAGPHIMRKSPPILLRGCMACDCSTIDDVRLHGHAVVMGMLLLGLAPRRPPRYRIPHHFHLACGYGWSTSWFRHLQLRGGRSTRWFRQLRRGFRRSTNGFGSGHRRLWPCELQR
jgi:hypothetical protein